MAANKLYNVRICFSTIPFKYVIYIVKLHADT